MKLPMGLTKKYRVNQVLINEGCFYCARVFDFLLNKVVLLTVLGNIERAMFDTIKATFESERKNENFEFVLDVFTLDYLESKELYYTQELGETLSRINPRNIVDEGDIRDWFYKLSLPTFYRFLDMSKQKNTFHGFISPHTIYYSGSSFKIGDYILGILLELNPQTMIESPWFNDSFFLQICREVIWMLMHY